MLCWPIVGPAIAAADKFLSLPDPSCFSQTRPLQMGYLPYSSALPIILFLLLTSMANGFPYGQQKGRETKRSEDLEAEKALNRTLRKLHDTDDGARQGRFVLLVCKMRCLKERAEVSRWVRTFNGLQQQQNNSSAPMMMRNSNSSNNQNGFDGDSLGFHFHQLYRKPFPVPAIERTMKKSAQQQAALFYVVAGQAIPAPQGLIGRKEKFMKWLDRFERPKIEQMAEGELDQWLDSKCHGNTGPRKRADDQLVLLVIHDPEICPEILPGNVARTFANRNHFSIVQLRRPLSEDAEFLLHWRMKGLSNNCRMDILLWKNKFLELPPSILGSELHQISDSLNSRASARNCTDFGSPLQMLEILPPVGPIELGFLREERHLKAIEHNKQYLMVGAIGGVSILALAMSIFWGLNGNDFVPKQ